MSEVSSGLQRQHAWHALKTCSYTKSFKCKTPDMISYGESLRLVRTGELPNKPRSGALTAVGQFSEKRGVTSQRSITLTDSS